jgi:hypothetical protein
MLILLESFNDSRISSEIDHVRQEIAIENEIENETVMVHIETIVHLAVIIVEVVAEHVVVAITSIGVVPINSDEVVVLVIISVGVVATISIKVVVNTMIHMNLINPDSARIIINQHGKIVVMEDAEEPTEVAYMIVHMIWVIIIDVMNSCQQVVKRIRRSVISFILRFSCFNR